MATIEELTNKANLVANATEVGENTAARVGGVLQDAANLISGVINKLALVNMLNVNLLDGSNASKTYTLQEAIAAIPVGMRRGFLKITFRRLVGEVVTAQYTAPSVLEKDFLNPTLWQTLNLKAVEDASARSSYSTVFNIHEVVRSTAPTTFEAAVAALPPAMVRCCMKIVYRTSYTETVEATYKAASLAPDDYKNKANWNFATVGNAIYKGVVVKSILDFREDGYYNLPYEGLKDIADRPSGLNASAAVQVFGHASGANGIQILTDTSGNMWTRWFSQDGSKSGAWVKVSAPASAQVLPKTRWYALGDSITEGYYSENGELKGITAQNYPYYVSQINGYEVTNFGEGGGGYVHHGTVAPKTHNAKELVNTIDFSKCDLVTIAYGVNDWHYNCDIGSMGTSTKGDGTMVGNMMYCVEKILGDNPNVKLIIILPHNTSAFGGNVDSNWGLGASLPTSGTLQDVIRQLIAVCEYYGLQYIDQARSGIVNRVNIKALLPDGLHPAKDGYLQIARYLARQIAFA